MAARPDKPLHLHILSMPSHLPVVRAAVEKLCQQLGFSAETAGKIILSVDEALTNIIRHAYDEKPDKPIEVELTPLCDAIQIVLRDYGRPVDPSVIRSRDLNDLRPGGLGVHIMTCCMDRIEYRPVEDGAGTVLTMTKRLPKKNHEE
ncbi:MAG: ATP-binding protein [Planctomycetes bacterium]|nr:ATP-binding protein [Planctomycetota bacterium]